MTARAAARAIAVAFQVACLAQAAFAADRTSDPTIDRWIRKQAANMSGVEQKEKRYAAVGDLDGDGRDDVAVLYTVKGMGKADYRLRYLAVFHGGRRSLAYRAHRMVGGRGVREVNRVTILRRTVVVETLEYRPRDAMCCPSRAAKRRYRLIARKLVRLPDPVSTHAP